MPRLGRFLFGDWLKTDWVQPLQVTEDGVSFGAAYRDGHGAYHKRTVVLQDTRLRVQDELHGFQKKAVLRWRVKPGNWQLNGLCLSDGKHRLTITATVPIVRCELVEGWESRYYLQKTSLPVLEVEIDSSATISTEICWAL
jgi:hypothetical protein